MSAGTGGSGLRLGGTQKKKPVKKEDAFLDELLGESTKSLGQTDRKSAGISDSTAFGPTGPIRTTLDKKKPVAKGSDNLEKTGWDFDDSGGWGEPANDAWGSAGDWGSDGHGKRR